MFSCKVVKWHNYCVVVSTALLVDCCVEIFVNHGVVHDVVVTIHVNFYPIKNEISIELRIVRVLFLVKIEPIRVWSIQNSDRTPIEPPVRAKKFYFSR